MFWFPISELISLQAMFNLSEIWLCKIHIHTAVFQSTKYANIQWSDGITFSAKCKSVLLSALAPFHIIHPKIDLFTRVRTNSNAPDDDIDDCNGKCDYDVWLLSYRLISENVWFEAKLKFGCDQKPCYIVLTPIARLNCDCRIAFVLNILQRYKTKQSVAVFALNLTK